MSVLRNSTDYPVCIIGASLTGAIIGWLFFPEPRAIDGALVLAGIVNYPPDSVQGIYFHNMWTAIHQLLVLPLWLGVDQALLIKLFNAVLGASFVVGLALVMFALTESMALSLPGSLLVVLCGFFVQGPDYPILFFSGHSYGQMALSLSVICVGLFGNRSYLATGIVAGVLPAFHLVIGFWTIGVALVGSILVPAVLRVDTMRLLKGLAGGLVAAAVSFGFYWMQQTPMDVPLDAASFSAYLEHWDAHRQNAHIPRTGAVTLATLVLLWLLIKRGRQLNKPGVVLTAVVLMVSAAGSWALYEFVHYFHAALPTVVSGAILGRLVNLHYLLVFPIVVGFLYLSHYTAPLLLVLTLTPLILVPPLSAPFVQTLLLGNTRFVLILPACLLVALVVHIVRRYGYLRAGSQSIGSFSSYVFATIGIAGGSVGLYSLATAAQLPCSSEFIVIERCRIPDAFRKVAKLELPGLVIAPTGLAMMTHRHAHKPVILGASGFDFVPYLPQTAAQVKDVLQSLYGLDFRNPPAEYRNRGNLLPGMGREYWSKLATHDWHVLASKFCLGAVIAPADWTIHLDPEFEADGIRVYALPRKHLETCKISA